jgi:hypothetical protein
MMKKMTILYLLMFCISLPVFSGCSSSPPLTPKAVNDTSDYELFHTGTITNIYYNSVGYQSWFCRVQYNFADGSVIKMNNVKCDHLPKIGEQGSLYISREWANLSHAYKQQAYYLWIKDGEEVVEVVEVVEKLGRIEIPVVKTEEIKEEIKLSKWKDSRFSFPNVYQLVLIKLDNEIITTGRINEDKEWKIEIFRKEKGRYNRNSNFEVIEWKKLDI